MNARVLSVHYTLTDSSGKVLDSSRKGEPFTYMEGARQIIPGLEKRLMGLKAGDKQKVQVPASEAYGVRDESMVVRVPRTKLPVQDVSLGDRFNAGPEPDSPVFVVTALTDSDATLDGNHALAGVDLTFDVEIVNIRQATADEIAHGHAHGEHGHSH